MDCANTRRLADAVREQEIWKPLEILVQLQKGEDGQPEEVNLVTVIDEIPSMGRRKVMVEKSNRYYMTSNYNKNNVDYRRDHIVPFFVQACAKVGIEIRNRGWEGVHNKLTFKCVRGRLYSSQQSKKNQEVQNARQGIGQEKTTTMVHPQTGYAYIKKFKERKSKTIRPKEGEAVCPFQIVLKWEPNSTNDENAGTGRWYVFHGEMAHHGHLQKNADEVQLFLWHHTKESTRLAVNAMNIHLGCGSATQLLVNQHSQVFFTPAQLEVLRQSERRALNNPGSSIANCNLTPAERLFNYLQNEKDLSYCALFANVDIGEVLVTVNKKRGEQSQLKLQFRNLEMSSAQTNGHRGTEIIQAANLVAVGETDTPRTHTDRVLSALTVGGDGGEKKLLLGVAWVSDEQRRLATCFPEAWGVDVTFGTNAEQRPLLSTTLKMSTNQTMTHYHTFLPCVARWAYAWSFGVAMPKLLGNETLQRNVAICTDGEEKLYGPLVVLSQDDNSPWYGTGHYLCIYHLVDRQLGKEGLKGRSLGPIGEIYQSVVVCWIYSWSSDMETYEAFNKSYNLLMTWLRSDESEDSTSPRKAEHLGPALCDRWISFIHSKISSHASKFVFAKRLKIRSFNLRTTSNTEGEQGILKSKTSKTGVRPNMALDESTKAIQNLDTLRLRNKYVKHAKFLDQQIVKHQDEYKTRLMEDIVQNVVEEVASEYNASTNYFCHRVDVDTFWVFRKEYRAYSNTPTARAEFMGYMVPKFALVRTVKIAEFNGSGYLMCSCGLFERFGWSCRHCYKVRASIPIPQDCIVRHRIDYLRYFNKPGFEGITKILQECIKKPPPGPPHAYNNMMPLIQQLTNLADTDPVLYDILWQSLNGASIAMNSEMQRRVGHSKGRILSLPNVDKARKCSRKRQRSSPTKGKN